MSKGSAQGKRVTGAQGVLSTTHIAVHKSHRHSRGSAAQLNAAQPNERRCADCTGVALCGF